MRIAMLSPESFKKIIEFHQAAETFLEKEKFSMREPYEQWQDWDDDDPDRVQVDKIKRAW